MIILLTDITKVKKIKLNDNINRFLAFQGEYFYSKFVPKIKAIVYIWLQFQVGNAKTQFIWPFYMVRSVVSTKLTTRDQIWCQKVKKIPHLGFKGHIECQKNSHKYMANKTFIWPAFHFYDI